MKLRTFTVLVNVSIFCITNNLEYLICPTESKSGRKDINSLTENSITLQTPYKLVS